MRLCHLRWLEPAALGAVFGLAVHQTIARIYVVSVVTYGLQEQASDAHFQYLIAGAVSLLLLRLLWQRGRMDGDDRQFEIAVLPLLLLAPIGLAPPFFAGPLLLAAITGWTAFRLLATWPATAGPPLAPRRATGLLAAAAMLAIAYHTWLQDRALRALYLNYSDWAIYVDVVQNTLRGDWLYCKDVNTNYFASHVMPGSFLLMAPIVALWPSTTAVFLLSSVALYGGAVLLYAGARRLAVPVAPALLLALAVVFHPSLSQMALAIIYGFHPVYFVIPLVVLFFWLYWHNRMATAAVVCLCAVSIKETVAVFTALVGLVIALSGRRRYGLGILLFSSAYFLIITSLVMPALAGTGDYAFVDRYRSLGDSMLQIGLSPLLRPAAFLAAILRPHVFLFPGLVILPMLTLVGCRPLYLLPAAGMLAAICLQDNPEQATIALQYQSEALAMTWIAALCGLRRLAAGEVPRWLRWQLTGLRVAAPGRLATSAAGACLITAVMAWYSYGLSYVGPNQTAALVHAPAYDDAIAEVAAVVPEKVGLTATPRLANHFLFRNDVYSALAMSPVPPADFVLLDLDDDLTDRPGFETFRRRLVTSTQFGVAARWHPHGRTWLLYARGAAPLSAPPAPRSDRDWQELGEAVDCDLLRVAIDGTGQTLYAAPLAPLDGDVEMSVYGVSKTGQLVSAIVHFGNGELPAYLAVVAGPVAHPLPAAWRQLFIDQWQVRVRRKYAPQEGQAPFE